MKRIFLTLSIAASALGFQAQTSATFTDPRDGEVYSSISVTNPTDGKKVIWMAQNLRFKSEGSWAYNNDENNVKTYGRLYNWETAKKACPTGWHLPNVTEWSTLIVSFDGIKDGTTQLSKKEGADLLKSTTGWNEGLNGVNTSGFSALPGGRYGKDAAAFTKIGESGNYWTSAEQKKGDPWYAWSIVFLNTKGIYKLPSFTPDGISVRCVKD